ncbi:MAG: glycosyltransferase family 4 protein [Sedimentisphaerales bacterium]|nr:glycosyltransferase family 4 protein [Sedimentisphaerales bacterium]
MKILMLNYEFPPIGGGAANAHLCLLMKYAYDNSLKIDVLTSAPKPGLIKENFTDNITIYKVGLHKKQLHYWRKTEVLEWLLKAGFIYKKLLRENDYDFAHAFSGFPTGWLPYRSKDKLPYIISLRGSDVPGEHARLKIDYKILAPAFRAVWKNASVLVANSQGLKKRALKFMPSAEIDVIPNGVNIEGFSPAQTVSESQNIRLLTVGRLSVTKRVEILIEAIDILNKQGSKVSFKIVGGGQLLRKLKQMVTERKLDNIIELTDRIDAEDMPQVYRRNDIFVSASKMEGMSNAMLEAMASGLPIIAARCEGLEELIAENGLVIENASAQDFAKEIKILIDDPLLRRQMSLAARKKAEQFTWTRIAEQYLNIYERVK